MVEMIPLQREDVRALLSWLTLRVASLPSDP